MEWYVSNYPQHFEHFVPVAVGGVTLLVESYNTTSVLSEMIREIAKIDAR